eukprot:TRINITY_DN152_c0_g1_i6.p1 TRINITY_DN152_c0_g1~~TRINITY_DN152_c0_g1_i6.p1  ORF type:complete len:1294 (+),score=241.51 TRINITY_DN152_c0_g1_i6:1279-5160(+)
MWRTTPAQGTVECMAFVASEANHPLPLVLQIMAECIEITVDDSEEDVSIVYAEPRRKRRRQDDFSRLTVALPSNWGIALVDDFRECIAELEKQHAGVELTVVEENGIFVAHISGRCDAEVASIAGEIRDGIKKLSAVAQSDCDTSKPGPSAAYGIDQSCIDVKLHHTQAALNGIPPPKKGWLVGQVVGIDEAKGLGYIRGKWNEFVHPFKLAEVYGATCFHEDIVYYQKKHEIVNVNVIQIARNWHTNDGIPRTLVRLLRQPLRMALITVTARIDEWGCLLEADMQPQQAVQVFELSLRLATLQMHILLAGFFSKMITSKFMTTTLPNLLRSGEIAHSKVLLFFEALKKFVPTQTGLPAEFSQRVRELFTSCSVPDDVERVLQQIVLKDNDDEDKFPHEDFNSIFPRPDDFQDPLQHYSYMNLPELPVDRPFESLDQYIHWHYRLMRAETFTAFVYAVNHRFCNDLDIPPPSWVAEKIHDAAVFYRDVHIIGCNFAFCNSGLSYTLLFDMQDHENVEWEKRKRMRLGQLLAITTDKWRSEIWWAEVSVFKPDLLRKGVVFVRFLENDPALLESCILRNSNSGRSEETIMAEASSLFFVQQKAVLKSIASLAKSKKPILSFQDYLVQCVDTARPPSFLHSPERQQMLVDTIISVVQQANLDIGQMEAIKQLAMREFLVVQGPPGTGKSFTGVKMAQVLSLFRARILKQKHLAHAAVVKSLQKQFVLACNASQHIREQSIATLEAEVATLGDQLKQMESLGFTHTAKYAARTSQLEKKQLSIRQLKSVHHNKRALAEQLKDQCNREAQKLVIQDSARMREFGPIVVITYKNRALDEFLLDCLNWADRGDDFLHGVVRLGGGCVNKELSPYLSAHLEDLEMDVTAAYSTMLLHDLKKTAKKIKQFANDIVNNRQLTPGLLAKYLTVAQQKAFGPLTQARIDQWLGDEVLKTKLHLCAVYSNVFEQLASSAKHTGRIELDDESKVLVETAEDDKKKMGIDHSALASYCPILPQQQLDFSFGISCAENIWKLLPEERRNLADAILAKENTKNYREMEMSVHEFQRIWACLKEHKEQVKLDVLQKANVIGLTTTGCAIHADLIQAVRPSVIIVEEAAEMLEGQLLSAMANVPLQQMVLIGDHQQLRPITQIYPHAWNNKIDTSLFERMAANNLPLWTLTNQRRMTPSICRFVEPIYPGLTTDRSVRGRALYLTDRRRLYPDKGECVPGMCKNVFFWSHDHEEEETQWGGRTNAMQVRMATEIAMWLIKNGITPTQITVISPYSGQVRVLREAGASRRVC